jgi:UDP-N-acetylmuramoyl-L-alanyl-D-glutamate--2,6-diaminopimelate ligase
VTTTCLPSPALAADWLRASATGTLRSDSRRVRAGDAFLAWPGQPNDARRYVAAALAAGASACLVEHQGLEAYGFDDARVASLAGLQAATGAIADAYFEHPSRALEVLATTGTNGKTSTAWWTAQALTLLGRRCAVIGTLGVGEPALPGRAAEIEFTGLTTPDPVTLHAALRRFVDAGFAACAIEASSIGIAEQRLAGLWVAVAVFTNFTRDHLDYHGSLAAYWAAKRQLFAWPGLRAAVVNIDDEHGAALARELQGAPLDLWTYSTQHDARLRASRLGYVDGGLAFELREGPHSVAVRSSLVGDYNASNLLALIGGLRALGVPLVDAASVVPQLSAVPGRLQIVNASVSVDAPLVVVDYAHTPDALAKVLQALRPLAQARAGRLVCVFGCGGQRDASKRPLMGAIAARDADAVIVTSDNPRGEAPAAILRDILAGIGERGSVAVVEDRRAAIARAVCEADTRDVIVVAGKGHEDYQEIAGVKHPYSDVAEAEAALARRGLP